jgi:divalent metal cation (Fe/Co/Zn/Cd) transporter
MDGLLRVPGTKFRFGLNPLIDFVPGIGDVSAAFVSTSVLIYAVTRGLPKILLARMALNILINELVGIVPVVGSAFAFWFRANKRNYDLLQRHIKLPGQSHKSDWIFLLAVLVSLFVIVCAGLIVSFLILRAIAAFIFDQ